MNDLSFYLIEALNILSFGIVPILFYISFRLSRKESRKKSAIRTILISFVLGVVFITSTTGIIFYTMIFTPLAALILLLNIAQLSLSKKNRVNDHDR